MKRTLVLAAALAAALPFSALAHKAWLLPSQTVIAGNAPWITVDGAVSNDLFYFNHVPLRLESVVITARTAAPCRRRTRPPASTAACSTSS